MSKVENYTSFAENIARDNTHGYDQRDRNGILIMIVLDLFVTQ